MSYAHHPNGRDRAETTIIIFGLFDGQKNFGMFFTPFGRSACYIYKRFYLFFYLLLFAPFAHTAVRRFISQLAISTPFS